MAPGGKYFDFYTYFIVRFSRSTTVYDSGIGGYTDQPSTRTGVVGSDGWRRSRIVSDRKDTSTKKVIPKGQARWGKVMPALFPPGSTGTRPRIQRSETFHSKRNPRYTVSLCRRAISQFRCPWPDTARLSTAGSD